MITHHNVTGFDEFIILLDSLNKNDKIVLYFSGSVNEKGENWCPDCRLGKKWSISVLM